MWSNKSRLARYAPYSADNYSYSVELRALAEPTRNQCRWVDDECRELFLVRRRAD